MPADTIGGMSPNVWWIAAGSTKSSSTSARMDPAPGQILMVDMTKSNFSKFFALYTIIAIAGWSQNWISESLKLFRKIKVYSTCSHQYALSRPYNISLDTPTLGYSQSPIIFEFQNKATLVN